MVIENDEVIIKRKLWDEATHWNDVYTAESLILSSLLWNVRYMMTGMFQMTLIAPGASVFECYVQRVFIQMGLLKLIEVNKVVNV